MALPSHFGTEVRAAILHRTRHRVLGSSPGELLPRHSIIRWRLPGMASDGRPAFQVRRTSHIRIVDSLSSAMRSRLAIVQ